MATVNFGSNAGESFTFALGDIRMPESLPVVPGNLAFFLHFDGWLRALS